MYEHLVRGAFSFLAAAVTLAMAQEWLSWAVEDQKPWKLAPAVVLTGFALYEAHKVWHRVEVVLRLA